MAARVIFAPSLGLALAGLTFAGAVLGSGRGAGVAGGSSNLPSLTATIFNFAGVFALLRNLRALRSAYARDHRIRSMPSCVICSRKTS
ncbi:MAG: hypothetical protein DI562_10060 [Stenotrophomonas acidaminiphila]|nr:MAG: hypothetical protein DI562_10060 [Stenotrophomonas acidaminiphila]